MVKSAVVLADSLEDSKILVFTKFGVMGHYVAHLRPKHSTIFAFSPNLDVCRSLNLSRAVYPQVLQFEPDEHPSKTIDAGIELLHEQGHIHPGDSLIILSDVLQGEFVVDSVLLKKA